MAPTDRPYAGRSSEDRVRDRRDRLMAATLELVGIGGVAALSVRAISAKAGLTPRYFYEAFGTVEEVARQLFDREFDVGLARVGAVVLGAGPNVDERLSAAVGAMLDVLTEVPDRATLLLTEASGSGPLARRREERMEDVVTLLSAFGASAYGGADAASAQATDAGRRALRLAATFVAGGLERTVQAWLRGAVPGDRDALQRDLVVQIRAVGDAASATLETDLDLPGNGPSR